MSNLAVDNHIYLNVPKEEKDSAKALGARWDSKKVSWYTMQDNPKNKDLFAKWNIKLEEAPTQQVRQAPVPANSASPQNEQVQQAKQTQYTESAPRIFINVPKEEKDNAKALGARWDKDEISWYTTQDNPKNKELFAKWAIKLEEAPIQQAKQAPVPQNSPSQQNEQVQQAKQTQYSESAPRIFLNVPKEEKESAKALGARWDSSEVSWYTTQNNPKNNALFAQWEKVDTGLATSNFSKIKEFLGSVSSLNEVLAMKPDEKQRLADALKVIAQTLSPENKTSQNQAEQVQQKPNRMKM